MKTVEQLSKQAAMSESDILACHFLTINGLETGFKRVFTPFWNGVFTEQVFTPFSNRLETGFKLVFTPFDRNGMPVSDMPFRTLNGSETVYKPV